MKPADETRSPPQRRATYGDAPRAAGGAAGPQFRLECPQCRGWKMVPIENLDHLFLCRRCGQWYRVEGSSILPLPSAPRTVNLQVRTGFSEWRGDQYRVAAPRAALGACAEWVLSARWRMALAAAAPLTAAVLAIVLLSRLTIAPPVPAPLPTGLEQRVPLWVDAWLANDVRQLLRLSLPTADRQLRRWVARHPPPGPAPGNELASPLLGAPPPSTLPASEAKGLSPRKSEVTLTAVQYQGDRAAEITVDIRLLADDRETGRLALRQTWRRVAESWLYVPPSPSVKRRL